MLDSCCCRKILIWNEPADVESSAAADNWVSQGQILYQNGSGTVTAEGIDIHSAVSVAGSTVWTGNIDNYQLLLLPVIKAAPIWWAAITGATWTGRIHITGEHSGFVNSNAFLNTLTGMTGITINPDTLDSAVDVAAPVEALDLTVGVAELKHNDASETSGGTTVAKSLGTGSGNTAANIPWICRNKAAGIDWVVAGDSNQMITGAAYRNNEQFFRNLWPGNVPV